eukprot:353724-Chlamydomonas_euryale.AAC.2
MRRNERHRNERLFPHSIPQSALLGLGRLSATVGNHIAHGRGLAPCLRPHLIFLAPSQLFCAFQHCWICLPLLSVCLLNAPLPNATLVRDVQKKTSGSDPKNVQKKTSGSDPKNVQKKTSGSNTKNVQKKKSGSDPKNVQEKKSGSDPKNVQEKTSGSNPKNVQEKTSGSDPKNVQKKKSGSNPRIHTLAVRLCRPASDGAVRRPRLKYWSAECGDAAQRLFILHPTAAHRKEGWRVWSLSVGYVCTGLQAERCGARVWAMIAWGYRMRGVELGCGL